MKRKNWVKFKDLNKREKIFRVTNLIVMLLLFVACVAMAIYYKFVYDPNDRIIPAVCIAILSLLPVLFELIFGRRINNVVFLIIELYLIFAGLIGSVLNVYYVVNWYDIIIHILMGYFVAILGIFVAGKIGNYSKYNVLFVAVFCLCFSLAVEVLWEIFEWGADNLFNQTMQGEKIEGYGQPLIFDTMLDMVCNTVGALIFFAQYLIGKLSKFKFGINFIENNLIAKPNDVNDNKIESDYKVENIEKNEDTKENKKH